MELIKDYDYMIDYHPGKANVVAKEQNFSFFDRNIAEISVISEPRNEIANQ